MGDVGVVIPAGGRGRRMGGMVPKQFLPLCGEPILARSVRLFARRRDVSEVVVVAPSRYVERVRRLLRDAGLPRVRVVRGGRERQDSVRHGLAALSDTCSIVLIHDAVRPLVSPRVISGVIRAARQHGAAVVATPVVDTVKREGKKGYVETTVDRRGLWTVQTPQGFSSHLIRMAHESAYRARYVGTDDSSLVERLGKSVQIVEGNFENLKITAKKDIRAATKLLAILSAR